RRYWRTGVDEVARSLSKAAFARALRRLVPDLRADDLERGGAGVRAQAVAPDGTLVDDFHIVSSERAIHVLNAPSPAATASLAIGRYLAAEAGRAFGLAGAS
ncbi:MAG: L-2-hydroxyglutarate oxidase, partial [Armatimonadota bacterium]|nr:L-2-hydroxyglutarate oxidase [Armatimonadota bacterium]